MMLYYPLQSLVAGMGAQEEIQEEVAVAEEQELSEEKQKVLISAMKTGSAENGIIVRAEHRQEHAMI